MMLLQVPLLLMFSVTVISINRRGVLEIFFYLYNQNHINFQDYA